MLLLRHDLPVSHALSAFLHQQNLDSGEDQFQLISRLGVIATVDLGGAGQAGLDLQAQAESGHFLFLLRCDLRAFRAVRRFSYRP